MKYSAIKDIIEWDVPNWSSILDTWYPIVSKLSPDAKILAVGERNGGLSLWLALAGYKVDCTDRVEPTEIAKTLHKKYNVSDRVTYKTIDVVNDNLPEQAYDLVISKSVFGGLKENYADSSSRTNIARQKAVNNIYKAIKPGGYLLSADNTRGSYLLNFLRKKNNKDKNWHFFTPKEIELIFSSFQSIQISYFGVIPTLFSNRSFNRVIYFLNKYILAFMPANTRYIAITSARKSD